jgi:uncharacterized membrane protein
LYQTATVTSAGLSNHSVNCCVLSVCFVTWEKLWVKC